MKQIIFLLILINVSCTQVQPSNDNKEKEAKLESLESIEDKFHLICQNVRKNPDKEFSIDIKNITTFNWDTLIIVTPYFPFEDLDLIPKLDLSQLNNIGLHSYSDRSALAFIAKNELVAFAKISIENGKFESYNNELRIYTPETAIFKFQNTNKFITNSNFEKKQYEASISMVSINPINKEGQFVSYNRKGSIN